MGHARPSTHPSLRRSRVSIIPCKGAARSSTVSFPSLALTQGPPEPLSPAPEQRPGPGEQAVHQGDTDVPPLPTVRSRRSRRGQQLQPPVHPPEGCEGGAGHEEPRGRHGLARGLGPDRFLGPLRPRPRRIRRPLQRRRPAARQGRVPGLPGAPGLGSLRELFQGWSTTSRPERDWSSRAATAPGAQATDRVRPQPQTARWGLPGSAVQRSSGDWLLGSRPRSSPTPRVRNFLGLQK